MRVDVVEFPFQRQHLLRLVDGPQFPGPRVGGHQLDRDPGPPRDTGDAGPLRPRPGEVVDDRDLGVRHVLRRVPPGDRCFPGGTDHGAVPFHPDRELHADTDAVFGQVRGEIPGVPTTPDLAHPRRELRDRTVAAQQLDRAIARIPPGVGQIRCRWDAGYFAADLAKHCISIGVEFAIGVKRNSAVVRASRETPAAGWHPAKDMAHTEVAVIDYLPGTWPKGAGVTCIARRTRIPVELMPTDPRARKLRTIDKAQQVLALEGKLDYVYAHSFILTNLDVSTPAKLVETEHWYRRRTDIEALNKDAKHGAALRHLPSGDRTVNTVWMWAALLACAISNWIQEITGIDDGRGRARRTLARMRRELFNIPARVTHINRA